MEKNYSRGWTHSGDKHFLLELIQLFLQNMWISSANKGENIIFAEIKPITVLKILHGTESFILVIRVSKFFLVLPNERNNILSIRSEK